MEWMFSSESLHNRELIFIRGYEICIYFAFQPKQKNKYPEEAGKLKKTISSRKTEDACKYSLLLHSSNISSHYTILQLFCFRVTLNSFINNNNHHYHHNKMYLFIDVKN